MRKMEVPFVDLAAQVASLGVDVQKTLNQVVEECAFVRGRYVREFETQFGAMHDRHCVSVANGTDALAIALRALGVGPGDEVIVPAMTWISCAECVGLVGARPIFADVLQGSNLIDVASVESNLSGRTKVVLAVHLYGQPVDLQELQSLCQAKGVWLVEDCAQAHLAEFGDDLVGTIGDVGTFSFYPSKNLGAFGDAGAVLTADSELAQKVRRIANHGALSKHDHEILGTNSRMDGIQAAVLSLKLPYLEGWNSRRLELANLYLQALDGVGDLILPTSRPGRNHVYHLFAVHTEDRDDLRAFLSSAGISTGIHYPRALSGMPLFADGGNGSNSCPMAVTASKQTLSLPMFPELEEEALCYVCDRVQQYYSTG